MEKSEEKRRVAMAKDEKIETKKSQPPPVQQKLQFFNKGPLESLNGSAGTKSIY